MTTDHAVWHHAVRMRSMLPNGSPPLLRFPTTYLSITLVKVVATGWRRALLAFSAVRSFMLLSRILQLKHLTRSILKSLPNMATSVVACLVIYLMFAVLGVALFGGQSSQCALLSDSAGVPGCAFADSSVSLGTKASHSKSPFECRYTMVPLPLRSGVVPGTTTCYRLTY